VLANEEYKRYYSYN